MTFRQREFCRFYAQGEPSKSAALKAGYALSTAETNAARLLKSPIAQARILRLRGARLISNAEMKASREKATHILHYSSDDKMCLQAIRRLEALSKMQLLPEDDQTELDRITFRQAQKALQDVQQPTSQNPQNDSISLQPAEEEHKEKKAKKSKAALPKGEPVTEAPTNPIPEPSAEETIEEVDTLITGKPAFDRTLPKNLKETYPEPPTIIHFHPVRAPVIAGSSTSAEISRPLSIHHPRSNTQINKPT